MIFTAFLTSFVLFGTPALPPLQWSIFAAQAPSEARAQSGFHLGSMAELAVVNENVNAMISPERTPLPPVGNGWRVWPVAGWCGDYAVTKRHDLMVRGWPSAALLLAEVITADGQHHAVLVVHAPTVGWLVLDNLTWDILPTSLVHYPVVRIQSEFDPQVWFAAKELPR